MTNTLNTPVEAVEHAYPLRIEAYRIRRGTGGAGLHPGGDGIERSYAFDRPAEVTLLTERRARGPYGLAGGGSGLPGLNRLVLADDTQRDLPGKCRIEVEAGQRLILATPGGGGWGTLAP